MWIHALTKEVTALRPPEYSDEQAIDEGGVQDDTAGEPARVSLRWSTRVGLGHEKLTRNFVSY